MTGRYLGSRLFLSCDLIGSTPLKQQGDPWVGHFVQFYQLFPALLADKVDQLESPNIKAGSLKFWKSIGDELIFTYDVTDAAQVRDLVDLWVEAMDDFERDNKGAPRTKGSAFLATFPLPDREVAIPLSLSADLGGEDAEATNEYAVAGRRDGFVFDYLGPSVDTGFRIAELSDARYFTLSLEVAWAFAQAEGAAPSTASFTLMGTHELKGVWHGREYPVFALDRFTGREDPVTLALNKIVGFKPASRDQVIALATACLADSDWPSKVHLPDTEHCPAFADNTVALDGEARVLDEYADQQRMSPSDLRDDSGDELGSSAPIS